MARISTSPTVIAAPTIVFSAAIPGNPVSFGVIEMSTGTRAATHTTRPTWPTAPHGYRVGRGTVQEVRSPHRLCSRGNWGESGDRA